MPESLEAIRARGTPVVLKYMCSKKEYGLAFVDV
jgi:hypothetical protein